MSTFSRRTFLQRSAIGAGLFTFGGALLTACGDDDDAEADGLDVVTCQLGWKKLAQFGGHFMAQELGYFEEEGIRAEFLSGGPEHRRVQRRQLRSGDDRRRQTARRSSRRS